LTRYHTDDDNEAGEEADERAELDDGREHDQHVDRTRHILGNLRERLKPKDWEHHLRQVLEQIFNSLHLPQQDVELQPDVDLERDGGHRFQPEGGVVFVRIGTEPVLELLDVTLVRQVEMRSRHEHWRLGLTESHILDPSGEVVVVADIARAVGGVGEVGGVQLELRGRDPVN